ncbi:MAG: hypothetical protein V2A74_01525 [bacterium]
MAEDEKEPHSDPHSDDEDIEMNAEHSSARPGLTFINPDMDEQPPRFKKKDATGSGRSRSRDRFTEEQMSESAKIVIEDFHKIVEDGFALKNLKKSDLKASFIEFIEFITSPASYLKDLKPRRSLGPQLVAMLLVWEAGVFLFLFFHGSGAAMAKVGILVVSPLIALIYLLFIGLILFFVCRTFLEGTGRFYATLLLLCPLFALLAATVWLPYLRELAAIYGFALACIGSARIHRTELHETLTALGAVFAVSLLIGLVTKTMWWFFLQLPFPHL